MIINYLCLIILVFLIIIVIRQINKIRAGTASLSEVLHSLLLTSFSLSLITILLMWFGVNSSRWWEFPSSIIYAVQMFSLDTNIEALMELANAYGIFAVILVCTLMVINPILMFGTIAQMLITSISKYNFRRYIREGNLYIFP